MRTLALELAADMIRVNSVHPTAVDTDMIQNPATYELFAPDLPESERTKDVLAPRFQTLNVLPIPWVEPRRHLQRRALAGLRRGALRHRRHAAHRRGAMLTQVTRARPRAVTAASR